jgi:hypothetical protein
MSKTEKFKYAIDIKTKKLVHVDKVPNGQECGCVCPNPLCNSPLVAAANSKDKKYKQSSHFKHKNADCGYAAESVVHLLAKDIIERQKAFRFRQKNFPSPYKKDKLGKIHRFGKSVSTLDRRLKIHDIQLEKAIGTIRSDVYCTIKVGEQSYPINIEIKVSHAVDEAKKEKLKELKLTTIEVDLSDLLKQAAQPDIEKLITQALSEPKRQEWVYVSPTLRNKLLQKQIERIRKVVEKRNNDIDKWCSKTKKIELPEPSIVEAFYYKHRGKFINETVDEQQVAHLYSKFSYPDEIEHDEKNHFQFYYDDRAIDAFLIDRTFNLENSSEVTELVNQYRDKVEESGFFTTDNFFLFYTDFKSKSEFYWKNDEIRKQCQIYKKRVQRMINIIDQELGNQK